MCLDCSKLYSRSLKKEHGEYVGWKIYQIPYSYNKNKILKPQYHGKDQKVGEWLSEKKCRFTKDDKTTSLEFGNQRGFYIKGFHIYLSKREADSYCRMRMECLRKVYFRKILETGWQNNRRVIVARYLKILRVRIPNRKRRPRWNE